MKEYLDFAIEIAHYAGDKIKSSFLKDKDLNYKSDRTVVTDVDKDINHYLIEKVKEKYPNHVIVLVMVGNYTERGEVAIIDKFSRTEIALNHGIDLVIELPYPFATQSADYFAYGGITLLEELKVGKLIFGSESNDLDSIKIIAEVQIVQVREQHDALQAVNAFFGYVDFPHGLVFFRGERAVAVNVEFL